MKSLIHNTVSFFDRQFCGGRFHSTANSFAGLVAGYSHLSESDSQTEPSARDQSAPTAILCACLAKTERSSAQNEAQTSMDLEAVTDQFRSYISSLRGNLIFLKGDCVVAKFGDVDSAVQCAVNVQILLNRRNACRKANQQVRYRISINVCEADLHWAGLSSRGANLTPQLESSAYASGIFVSQLARKNMRDNSRIRFVSLGKRYLPNCKNPVEALWIEMDRSKLFDVSQDGSDDTPARVS